MEAKSDAEQEAEVSSQQNGATSSEPCANKIYRTADEVRAAHLIVALCYLRESSAAEALARMRANLLSFLAHYELPRVYNETITRFWIRRVRSLLGSRDSIGQEHDLAGLANEIIAQCGAPQIIFEYFSRERLAVAAAAYEWVEPDLRPLDF